jgi:hypothetical protein
MHPLDSIIDWSDIWASKDRLEGAIGAKQASGAQLTEAEMVLDRMILFGSYVFSSQTVYEHIEKYREHKDDLLKVKAYGMFPRSPRTISRIGCIWAGERSWSSSPRVTINSGS